jgi:hypothetical protein
MKSPSTSDGECVAGLGAGVDRATDGAEFPIGDAGDGGADGEAPAALQPAMANRHSKETNLRAGMPTLCAGPHD